MRIDFGLKAKDKHNGVFVCIFTRAISPWKYFMDEMKHTSCPAMIMIDRWDGRMGFPGGSVDKEEALEDALIREVYEEIGIKVKPQKTIPICSQDSEKIRTHLYGLEVSEVEFLHIYYHILNNFSRSILKHSYEESDESHFMSEITGIKIVPIIRHNDKGINKFLQNGFAGGSKKDIEIFLDEVLEISDFRD